MVLLESGVGAWRLALDGLRFRIRQFQHLPLLLLEARWTSEGDEINSFRKAVADAPSTQTGFAGVESAEPLQPSGGFHFSIACAQGKKASRSRGGSPTKNSAGISTAGNFRCWLAYLQALGWNHARRNGRAPAHDPRLPAARESERHKQVSSGDGDKQTSRPEQAGRGHSAERNSGSGVGSTFGPIINWTLIGPRFLEVKFVS